MHSESYYTPTFKTPFSSRAPEFNRSNSHDEGTDWKKVWISIRKQKGTRMKVSKSKKICRCEKQHQWHESKKVCKCEKQHEWQKVAKIEKVQYTNFKKYTNDKKYPKMKKLQCTNVKKYTNDKNYAKMKK